MTGFFINTQEQQRKLNQLRKVINSKHNYMLLARYQMDLKYYWGCGNQHPRHLYWKEYNRHVRDTIKLWKSLPQKPEWFRATELIKYKSKL